jgi:CHAT domain-containing protein
MSSLFSILLVLALLPVVQTPEALARSQRGALADSRSETEARRVFPRSQETRSVATQDATALPLGETISREIKGGANQSFRVALLAGQYSRFVVQQHGIILTTSLFDIDGKQVVEMDNAGGGHGPIYLSTIAPASGDYRLEVRSPETWANPGRFEVSIEDLREATPADRDRVSAERIFAEGRQLSNTGSKESRLAALKKYEESLAYWKTTGDRHWQALTLFLLAATNRRLGQLRPASEFFERVAALSLDEQDWRLTASSFNDRGLNFVDLGEQQLALESFNKAFRLYQDHQDKRGQASVYNNIGLAYHRIGALREAIENYEKAIPLRQAENDQAGEFNVRNNIGGVYDVSGEPHKALEQYRATLKVWQDLDSRGSLNNRDQLGAGFNNVAEAQNKLGEWQEALDYYKQALAIFQATGNSQREAACLDNMGQLYQDLGESKPAREHYQKAVLLLREKVKDADAEGNVLGHIGTENLLTGNLSEALQNFQTALTLRQNPRGQGYALINLGAVSTLQNSPQKALEFYDRALTLLKSSADQQGEAITLFKKGEAYSLLNDQSQAKENFARSLSIWRSIASPRGEATTLLGIAKAEAELNNLAEAVKYSEAALAIIESLRTNVSSSRLRASYFATQQNYYELNIDLNMRLYRQNNSPQRLGAALQASERSRARSLVDAIAGARVDAAGASEVLLKREREIQQKLTAKSEIQTRLLGARHTREQAEAIAGEIIELVSDDRELRDQIRTSSPKFAALIQPESPVASQFQRLLDADSLLVEYALGEKRSYVWAVTPSSIEGFELPGRAEIEAVAQRVSAALTERNREQKNETLRERTARFDRAETDYREASAQLSEMILEPVRPLLGQKRLLVVADGALQFVPFASLPTPPAATLPQAATVNRQVATTKSGTLTNNPRLLIEDHEIISLPSASVLAVQRRELANRKPASFAVAIIADPVFDLQDSRVAAALANDSQHRKIAGTSPPAGTLPLQSGEKNLAAPATSAEKLSPLGTALRDVGLDPFEKIRRLDFSRQEAASILQGARAKGSLTAFDFKASRATATSPELSKYRIIHFATHGVLDLEHPELSGIILSLVDEKGRPQDGYLRLHEIYNLNLPAELVVLSACQTGIGKQIKGEGLIALTRGFMYAGAARVVASLWKVDDEATSELMAEFYKQMLTNNLSAAAALRAAQVKISQKRPWQSPYYWAGFVLQGEWK